MQEQKKPSWGPLEKRFGGKPHPRKLLALDGGGIRDILTLIALWDGEPTGDGPGGTSDLVRKVQECGARRHSEHERVVGSLEITATPSVPRRS